MSDRFKSAMDKAKRAGDKAESAKDKADAKVAQAQEVKAKAEQAKAMAENPEAQVRAHADQAKAEAQARVDDVKGRAQDVKDRITGVGDSAKDLKDKFSQRPKGVGDVVDKLGAAQDMKGKLGGLEGAGEDLKDRLKGMPDGLGEKMPNRFGDDFKPDPAKLPPAAGLAAAGRDPEAPIPKSRQPVLDSFQKVDGWSAVPKHLPCAPNEINRLVIDQEEMTFTVLDLANKLKAIEEKQGYEAARYTAKQLNYQSVCDICVLDDIENDPNLMPSRFMLLPGASDGDLTDKGNLDDIPWPVHPDGPQKMSIELLSDCLTVLGYYEGEMPVWKSANLWAEGEQKEQDPWKPYENALSGDLLAAFKRYLEELKPEVKVQKELSEGFHVVEAGDTLGGIAKECGYSHWQILYEANTEVIENPDMIVPGMKLTLPPFDAKEIEGWLEEHDAPASAADKSKGYHFPAKYYSLSLVDKTQALMEREEGWEYEASVQASSHVFYHFKLATADQLRILMPDGDDIGMRFGEDALPAHNTPIKQFNTTDTVLLDGISISFAYQIDLDDPDSKNDVLTLEHNESDWSQSIELSTLDEFDEDWVRLKFMEPPATGTFNLLQDPGGDEEPYYIFWDVPLGELGRLTPEAEPLPVDEEAPEEEPETPPEDESNEPIVVEGVPIVASE